MLRKSSIAMTSPHSIHLIVYSKPGCHLCEGLLEKLGAIASLPIHLEVRDITTRDDWFQAYQYDIPVVYWVQDTAEAESKMVQLPRVSPRASVGQVERWLQQVIES